MSKPDRPEHRFSHWVDVLMDRILLPPCYYTAVDTGTQVFKGKKGSKEAENARFAWENHRRYMGIKPYHLDWYGWQGFENAPPGHGIYTQFELKYGKNDTNDGQDQTLDVLRRNNIPTGVYRTIVDVFAHMRDAGFRLHGNAASIAHEVELRWRAADEAARGAVAAPKKRRASARSAYPTRPSKAALARGARMAAVRP